MTIGSDLAFYANLEPGARLYYNRYCLFGYFESSKCNKIISSRVSVRAMGASILVTFINIVAATPAKLRISHHLFYIRLQNPAQPQSSFTPSSWLQFCDVTDRIRYNIPGFLLSTSWLQFCDVTDRITVLGTIYRVLSVGSD